MPCPAFAPPHASLPRPQGGDCLCNRRAFIYTGLAAAAAASTSSARAAAAQAPETAPPPPRVWLDEELCKVCLGCGTLPCMLCDGSGVYIVDDGQVIDRAHVCPNCGGEKFVGCLKCISTGLRDTKGFLRDASADGRIRMRRNGTFEVLRCDALPSCSIHGLNRTPESDA